MNDFEIELGNFLADTLTNVIRHSVTPLNGSNERKVTQWGTGTFVLVDGMIVIVTCQHVIRDGGREYGFYGSDYVTTALDGIMVSEKVDAAMIHVPEFEWTKVRHEARPLPIMAFTEKHDPVPKELFYVLGFGEENTEYFGGQLDVHGLGYLGQIDGNAPAHDKYFYLKWNRPGTEVTNSTTEFAAKYVKNEDPHGMSGSLVFDTGYFRAMYEGRDWSPLDVKVTGLLERWVEADDTLEVRRIEAVLGWMRKELGNTAGPCTI